MKLLQLILIAITLGLGLTTISSCVDSGELERYREKEKMLQELLGNSKLSLIGENILEGDILIETQEQLESFREADIREIQGTLDMYRCSTCDDLTPLSGLYKAQNLYINAASLSDFDGLEILTEVEELEILEVTPVLDFSAFNQLSKAYQIRIVGEFPRKLDSFNELECAHAINFLFYNSDITIAGFNNLKTVYYLDFNGVYGLDQESIVITGFKNLQSMGEEWSC